MFRCCLKIGIKYAFELIYDEVIVCINLKFALIYNQDSGLTAILPSFQNVFAYFMDFILIMIILFVKGCRIIL